MRPGPRRKVVLSTNVAESSVTIDGVTAVVDSGLARVASHSPWSGLPRLEVRRVSRASATQRAGRAGRTAPGRCLRLYTRHDFDTRPEFDVPEILREDLSETLLAVASMGGPELRWLDAPPAPSAAAARELLRDLGALDAAGAITPGGRRLLRFPLHPRLARLVVEADDRGAGPAGALLAALLAERDVRERAPDRGRGTPPTGPSDLLELAHLFEQAARSRFDPDRLRSLGLSPGAVQAVERSRRQVAQLLGRGPSRRPAAAEDSEEALLLATLAAYPDRVARRRAPGSPEVVLSGGGSARLDEGSVVRDAPLLVAVDADERRDRRGPGPAPGLRARRAGARARRLRGHAGDDPGALPGRPSLGGGALLERRGRPGRRLRADALPRPRPRGVAQARAGPGARRGAARRGGAGPRGAQLRRGGGGGPAAGPRRLRRPGRAGERDRPARRGGRRRPRSGRPAPGAAASPSSGRPGSRRRSWAGSLPTAAPTSSGSPRSGSRSGADAE